LSLVSGAVLLAVACSGGGAQHFEFDGEVPVLTTVAGGFTFDDADDDPGQSVSGDDDEIQADDGEIAVFVDSARPLDRRLFGTNVPAWIGPDRLADPAFQAATMALGTTLLRFPGGSWSNGYDWLACEQDVEPECFAPDAARPADFAGFMGATGIPGSWTVSFSGTPEEAAAAVAYFNGEIDDETVIGVDALGRNWETVAHWARLRAANGNFFSVGMAVWEVGNEIYAARPEAGPECASFGWEDTWTCDGTEYVEGDDSHAGYLEFREAMRAVDPEIAVGAVGIANASEWGDWGNEVIAAAGSALDFYAVHHYAFDADPVADVALQLPQETWPLTMSAIEESLIEGDADDVPVAITEYNLVAVQEGDTDALMAKAVNMLYVADTIGQMAVNDVAIANQWNLANGRTADGTDYGMIDVETYARSPQYYALALWTRFGDELLAADVGFATNTEISAYAGRADDGTISVLAVNKTAEPTTAQLRIVGGAASYTGRADVAAAGSLDATVVAFNGSDNPSVDLTEPPATDLGELGPEFAYTFEPYSVTLLRLTPGE
jgi:hypothetical protein